MSKIISQIGLSYKNYCKIIHGKSVKKSSVTYLYSDVDDTLVIWPDNPFKKHKNHIPFDFNGNTYYLKPHKKNIETLKKYHKMGWTIIIWSLGGDEWASKVCDTLKLTSYVKHCLCKPVLYIDDLSPSEWMGENIFLKEDE
jgi:hypothetical protein